MKRYCNGGKEGMPKDGHVQEKGMLLYIIIRNLNHKECPDFYDLKEWFFLKYK
jgi:hypothetical protein